MRMLLLLKKGVLWTWFVAYTLIGSKQRLQSTQYINIAGLNCDSRYREENRRAEKIHIIIRTQYTQPA